MQKNENFCCCLWVSSWLYGLSEAFALTAKVGLVCHFSPALNAYTEDDRKQTLLQIMKSQEQKVPVTSRLKKTNPPSQNSKTKSSKSTNQSKKTPNKQNHRKSTKKPKTKQQTNQTTKQTKNQTNPNKHTKKTRKAKKSTKCSLSSFFF